MRVARHRLYLLKLSAVFVCYIAGSTTLAHEHHEDIVILHRESLQQLLSETEETERRFDQQLVVLPNSCQLLWVSRRSSSCEFPNEIRQRIISVDLSQLQFRKRRDEWAVVEFIYGNNRRDIGTAQTLSVRSTPDEALENIEALTENLRTMNFIHSSYCEDTDTVLTGAGGQYVYLSGETARLFEEQVTNLASKCSKAD